MSEKTAKIRKRGNTVKANKFIQIKNFFGSLMTANYNDMDYFIQCNSLLVISEKMKEGYILDESQEYALNSVLKINHTYFSQFEKLFKSNLPEKYIYGAFFENGSQILLNKEVDGNSHCLPLTKDWLVKQDKKILAIEFSKHWMQSVELMLKMSDDKQLIHKKINQIKTYQEFLDYLSKENKNELLEFVINLSKKSNSFYSNLEDERSEINSIIVLIQKSDTKKEEQLNSIQKISFQLKEENEIKVWELLTEVNQQFNTIFVDIKDMDMMKKESLMKLYHVHLVSNLNQYLHIKKELRTQKNVVKQLETAQDLISETLVEVKKIFEVVTKEINEDKLMSLSSKNEYFTQLKKQW